MTATPPPSRRRVRRIWFVAAPIAAIALVSLVLARPWSSHNSFRQTRIFAPSERVRNFQHMDELFPARVVHRSPTPHRFTFHEEPLPKTFSYQGRDVSFDDFFDRTVATGFLVLRGDTVVSERYFRGATKESALTSWSVAKSVVSLLYGVARAEHRVNDLGATLSEYVPSLAGSAYGKVPLRAALTMSSGIRFGEEYDDPLSDIHLMFARIFYFRESAAHYLSTLPAETAPGTRFHYASSDTFALGLALSNAVHEPLSTYLEQKLWKPLGMEYDALWNTESDDGAELGFCCLNVRLRDYAKIGRLVARHGDWDGTQVVPADWLAESTRVEVARPPSVARPHPSWDYGYQWWVPGPPGACMAAGVWGQFIYVDTERQVVVVKTSVDPEFMEHGDENVAAFEAVVAAL